MPELPEMSRTADGDRVLVTVGGELCLDDCDLLEHTLRTALAGAVQGVDLDLGSLEFWDCSALDVLLTVRRQALAAGKTLTVTAAGAAAQRLLGLTGTRALFTPSARPVSGAGPVSGPGGEPVSRSAAERPAGTGLRAEVLQLRRAMRTRPEIDMARGILMASFRLSAEEAWEVLVMASQNTNTKLCRLATNVVTTVQGTPLPAPVRRQLTTAVATVTAAPRTGARGGTVPGRR
ncbi:ANTAR domain-containing protein [Streptomyces sp. NPDC047000]|uniref:ANTAR domain-containing protein n=1 Tax=Streptomyces sp. NPDC047000 TaxID=3155474 RepID=UPI0033E6CBF3